METITPTSIDSTITWIAMGKDLIKCLKSKGNHRLSRYDAFLWIIENIQKGCTIRPRAFRVQRWLLGFRCPP